MKAELQARLDGWNASPDWVVKRSDGGARASLLAVPGEPPALRFEVELDCAASACADYTIHRLLETQGEWNHSFLDGDRVDEGDHRLYRLAYAGVWPVKPRDFVYRAWISPDDDGGATEISGSVVDERFGPAPGRVRGRILLAWRRVEALGPDRCRYTSIAQSDIGGHVPGWMVTPGVIKNMFSELGHIRVALGC